MRIVLAAEGTRGDVHPFLALAALLAARGAEVLVCAPPDFEAEARERGLPYRSVGPPVRAFLEQQAASVHGTTAEILRAGRDFIEANLPQQMAAMVDAVRGADLVLAASTQAAAVTAAELHGARHRFVAYAPGIIPASDTAPIMMPWPRLHGLPARVAWWFTRVLANALLRGLVGRERAKLGLPPVRDVMEHVIGTAPLLAADEELAPAPRGARVPVESIGCLHPFDADAPLPGKLETFLAAGEPPVYVGFGSMTDPAPAATTRLVLDAVARAGVRAILSRGWAGLGDGPLPGDVIEIGPVSHAALFGRVAAVVHHGGAGTTTMAARAGTPQVVVPHLLDQHYWGARVVDLGLGPPPLPRRRLSAAALAGALSSLRDNDLVAERAAELGERLRERLRTRDVVRIVLGDARGRSQLLN